MFIVMGIDGRKSRKHDGVMITLKVILVDEKGITFIIPF